MNQSNSLDFKELTDEESKIMSKHYSAGKTFVRVGQKGYVFPKKFTEIAPDIKNLDLREGDTFVASYPRSGTTWCQELVWLIANDLNYEKAANIPLTERYSFLEYAMHLDEDAVRRIRAGAPDAERTGRTLERLSSLAADVLPSLSAPRFVKTHLPLSLLPDNILETAKVVYVARDPRDMAVSYYHFINNIIVRMLSFDGTFKEFWNSVIRDLCLQTPYFEHVKESWTQRHHPNMLFLFYEELSTDLPGVIRRVADFFGKSISQEQIERLCRHLDIKNIKKNTSVNMSLSSTLSGDNSEGQFIRTGKVGGWREYFDEEMERQAERWLADSLRGTDLVYPTVHM